MKYGFAFHGCASLAIVAGAFMAAPASAADDALTIAPSQPYEELVVTATRQGAPLRDLPGNTSRLSTDDVDFIRQDHAAEILNTVAGVGIHRGNGQEHLTAIRSPVLTGGAGAGSFLFMEDGISLRAAGFANVNGLFEANTEQAGGIEVMRGPGSAFYGSNALHGLVNVLSRAPSKGFEHELDGSGGPHDLYRTKMSTSGTVGRHGYRLSFNGAHDGGWRFASGYDQQKTTLRYDYSGVKDTLRMVMSGQNLNQETAGFVTGYKSYKDDVLKKGNPNPDAFRDVRSARVHLRWDRVIDKDSEFSITPYFRFTEMKFLMHFLPSQALEKNGHKSGGFQSAYYRDLPGGHRVILGTDLEFTSGYMSEIQENPTIFGTYTQGTHYDYDVDSWVVAPYFHTEWQLGEKTRLTVGLRYEHTRYDYDDKTTGGIVGRFLRAPERVDTFDNFSPKVGVVHHVNDDLSAYLNLARGTRAPQTTDAYRLQSQQVVGQIDSETLDSVEFGVRGEQWGISYDVAAFYMEKEDFFFRNVDGFNVTNGKTRHRGVEFSLFSQFLDHFDAAANFTYAKHTYNFNGPVNVGINMTEGITDGDDVDTAPRTIGNVRLGWNAFNKGRLEAEWVHMGRYYLDASNQHKYPGHDVLNLRARWDVTKYASIHARINNLIDTEYADRADFFRATHRYFPGEERSGHIGVTFRY
jgi:iron complex outermembrane recepter protein